MPTFSSNNDRSIAEAIRDLAEAIKSLSCEKKTEFEWLRSHVAFATKQDLDRMECRLMSAISDFSDRVTVKFDAIATSVDGVKADVAFLKAKIEELQNTPGPITPADQAILDALEARVGGLSTAVDTLDKETESAPLPPA